MTVDLCKHDLDPATCSTCLHGVSKPEPKRSHGTCRSCQAEILWVETENCKTMPLDAESGGPDAHFRFVKGKDNVVHFVKRSEKEANTDPLYASHFITCEDADMHRRR